MSSYVVFIDLQIHKKRFLSRFHAFFCVERAIKPIKPNALLKEKQEVYSHLLKGL